MHAVAWFPFGPGLLPFLLQLVRFLLWNTKSINNKSVIWSINSGHVAPTDSTTLLSALGVKSAATTQSMPTPDPRMSVRWVMLPLGWSKLKGWSAMGEKRGQFGGIILFFPFSGSTIDFFERSATGTFCHAPLIPCLFFCSLTSILFYVQP